MRAIIKIGLENGAFRGGGTGPELARILRRLAEYAEEYENLKPGKVFVPPMDYNGNTVGSFKITR